MRLLLAVPLALVLSACSGSPAAPGASPEAHTQHRASSLAPPKPLRAGERFQELTMPRAFTPAADSGGTDEYRCFLVDPGISARTFITGSQFLPQNPDIVHHAIFFRVQPDQVDQAKQLDVKDDGDGWTCFGGTGIGAGDKRFRQLSAGADWIAAWAPGGDEVVLGADLGYELEPGSQVVMQIHYNLLTVKGAADRSGIRLRLSDGTPAMRPLQTTLLPAPVELPCTAQEKGPLCDREKAVLNVWHRFGEPAAATVAGLNLLCNGGGAPKAGQVQSCDHKVRDAGTAYAAAGHMHLLGRSIKIELNPHTPQMKVLLDVSMYNFDDQGARLLPEPVRLKAGDTLRVTCTHDALLRKQLPALSTQEPRYVVWGDGTSDEMCLGILTWTH